MPLSTTPTNGEQPRRPDKQETSSRKKRKRPPSDINYCRRRNIASLVVHRHGRLAKAALCIPYAAAAAWHCPSDSERRFLMMQWCRWTCAPPSVEHQIDSILEANPARRIRADTLGRHLHVSDAERSLLRIWTIGSFDVPKAKRIKRRKERRRLAEQARRRARGAKPREQALTRTKPWEAAGFRSRRTWERHGKPVSQIRGQYTSLSLGHESATSSTARGRNGRSLPKEEHPLQAVRRPREITAAAKNNGHHRPRQRRVAAKKKKPTEQRAVPRIVHLEAISLE